MMATPTRLTHVLCAECEDEPEIYLCGTPRTDDDVVAAGTPAIDPPCVVCFSREWQTCTQCGHVVIAGPFIPEVPSRWERFIDSIRRFFS